MTEWGIYVKTSSVYKKSEVKDMRIVGIYPSRYKTVILFRPGLTQVIRVNSLILWLGVKRLIYM